MDGGEIVRELRGRGMWMWEIFGWAGGGEEILLSRFKQHTSVVADGIIQLT